MIEKKVPLSDKKVRATIQAVKEKLQKYHMDTGKSPSSILMGPNDYLAILKYVHEHMPTLSSHSQVDLHQNLTFVFGVPIRIKQGPGIDVELVPRDLAQFAIGTIEKKEDPQQ